MSRRPFFARDTSSCPIKSWRTFNELNRSLVRVLAADGPLSATSAVPRQHKPHDQALHSPLRPEQSTIGAVIRTRSAPASLSSRHQHASHSPPRCLHPINSPTSLPLPCIKNSRGHNSTTNTIPSLARIVRHFRTLGDSVADLVRQHPTTHPIQQGLHPPLQT